MNKSKFPFSAAITTFLVASLIFTGCGQGSIKIESVDDEVKASSTAEQLFLNVKSKISSDEKNKIAELTGLHYSPATKKFDSEGEEVEVQIVPVDINHDQSEDIFVITYSTYLYGNTGQGFSLLMKNESEQYSNVLSLPGIPQIIDDKTSSMPPIQIGGPGFSFPVYTWKNHRYQLNKNYKINGSIQELDVLGNLYSSGFK